MYLLKYLNTYLGMVINSPVSYRLDTDQLLQTPQAPTSPFVIDILGYPQAVVRKFDDKWSGGDYPRHSALY